MEVVIAYPNPIPACCRRALGSRVIEWCRPSDDKAAGGPRAWHLVTPKGDGTYGYEPVLACPFCERHLDEPAPEVRARAEVMSAVDVVSRVSTNNFESLMARHGFEPMAGEDITDFLARSMAEIGPEALAALAAHYGVSGA